MSRIIDIDLKEINKGGSKQIHFEVDLDSIEDLLVHLPEGTCIKPSKDGPESSYEILVIKSPTGKWYRQFSDQGPVPTDPRTFLDLVEKEAMDDDGRIEVSVLADEYQAFSQEWNVSLRDSISGKVL